MPERPSIPREATRPPCPEGLGKGFAGAFGLLLGLGLLKFGNPVVLDHLVTMPRGFDEWRAFAWPVSVAHFLLLPVAVLGLVAIGRHWRFNIPAWLLASLGVWWAIQAAATVGAGSPPLARAILLHFSCLTVCFLLGHLALSRVAQPRTFWICVLAGFVGVIGMAVDQRFGGLEATRKMILENADVSRIPPEYLARIRSNRVFSTLVYPNALAGAVLLVLPFAVVAVQRALAARGQRLAGIGAAAVALLGLSVLVWSGSKAGWLIALGMGVVVFLQSTLPRAWKTAGILVAILGGLGAFGWLYGERLRQGATSVVARFDYWEAAWKGFTDRPVLGHGPGGFKEVYARVRRPESEMAQLAHNDYLQQATDSGAVGFLAYLTWVGGALMLGWRRTLGSGDAFGRAVWLGLLAWFAQGMVEFGLYIPATSWLAFALLGWLLAQPVLSPPARDA